MIPETNQDILPDDLVSVFHKKTCKFGFVTHLFGAEVKSLHPGDVAPRGATFRISPTSNPDQEPATTLTQDFHTRLDNLLRTLVHAKPHFIRCIRPNDTESYSEFNRTLVRQQIRSLQILETLNLMADGFPHRMRFKNFVTRYKITDYRMKNAASDMAGVEESRSILENLSKISIDGNEKMTEDWAVGKKHVFLSELVRQKLEELRTNRRHQAATVTQALWRGYVVRKKWPHLLRQLEMKKTRSRPRPITGTPEPGGWELQDNSEMSVNYGPPHLSGRSRSEPRFGSCDLDIIQNTCSMFGLDLVR